MGEKLTSDLNGLSRLSALRFLLLPLDPSGPVCGPDEYGGNRERGYHHNPRGNHQSMPSVDTHTITFVSGFVSVFTLGFQSRAVNAGNFILAGTMSFVVAMSQGFLWKHIASGDGSVLNSAVYGMAGSMAIMSSMWTHKKFFGTRK